MIDVKLVKKWIAALRSGKYRQGKGYLKQRRPYQETEYCCMGVLEEVAGTECDKASPTAIFFTFGSESEGCWPTRQTAKRAGILDCQHKLSAMNDGTGEFYEERVDFLGIANWIETHILKPALGKT